MFPGCRQDAVGKAKEYASQFYDTNRKLKRVLTAVCASHKYCSKCGKYEVVQRSRSRTRKQTRL